MILLVVHIVHSVQYVLLIVSIINKVHSVVALNVKSWTTESLLSARIHTQPQWNCLCGVFFSVWSKIKLSCST